MEKKTALAVGLTALLATEAALFTDPVQNGIISAVLGDEPERPKEPVPFTPEKRKSVTVAVGADLTMSPVRKQIGSVKTAMTDFYNGSTLVDGDIARVCEVGDCEKAQYDAGECPEPIGAVCNDYVVPDNGMFSQINNMKAHLWDSQLAPGLEAMAAGLESPCVVAMWSDHKDESSMTASSIDVGDCRVLLLSPSVAYDTYADALCEKVDEQYEGQCTTEVASTSKGLETEIAQIVSELEVEAQKLADAKNVAKKLEHEEAISQYEEDIALYEGNLAYAEAKAQIYETRAKWVTGGIGGLIFLVVGGFGAFVLRPTVRGFVYVPVDDGEDIKKVNLTVRRSTTLNLRDIRGFYPKLQFKASWAGSTKCNGKQLPQAGGRYISTSDGEEAYFTVKAADFDLEKEIYQRLTK